MIEVLEGGGSDLICCGEKMSLFNEKTSDEGREKHIPVVEVVNDKDIRIKVGSDPHPMEEKHYIQWIEVFDGNKTCRLFLKPGQPPEAVFKDTPANVEVREYCNLHGIWKA